MPRYNFRELPHRNMANQNVNDNPVQPAENININPAPLDQNNDMLQELRIISQELSSQGSLNKITPFDGTDLSKFRVWTREVSKQCAILGLNEDAKKRVLFSTASGAVSLFLERYLRENDQATYKQILDELRKRFSNMANTHTALQALRHLQQKSHENIQTFYEKLLDLAEQAFLNDAINEQGNQDQLLTIFIDGLTDVRIRRHVIRKRPRNVGEALSHAIDEHDMLNEIDTRASSSDKKVSDKHTPHHGYINQTRTQQATPQQYPPPPRGRGFHQPTNPPPCQYCTRPGFHASSYYHRQQRNVYPHANYNDQHINYGMPQPRPPPPHRRTAGNNWQRASAPRSNYHNSQQTRHTYTPNQRQSYQNNTQRRLN